MRKVTGSQEVWLGSLAERWREQRERQVPRPAESNLLTHGTARVGCAAQAQISLVLASKALMCRLAVSGSQ